jgi:hypothetical protein
VRVRGCGEAHFFLSKFHDASFDDATATATQRTRDDEYDDDDERGDVRGGVRCADGARTFGDGWCATNDDDDDAG